MALNRFMHPQNPYKFHKPDFCVLRDKYPEFREATRVADERTEIEASSSQQESDSDQKSKRCNSKRKPRVEVDFSNARAAAALTRTLLQEDFHLNVDLPGDSLVPALPLRLNYLLWLRELLENCSLTSCSSTDIVGIDVGTGPSCIYALLGATRFGWRFVGSEVQAHYVNVARENVRQNGLSDRVSVQQVTSDSFLAELLRTHDAQSPAHAEQRFHFTMCNPPFFRTENEDAEFATPSVSSAKRLREDCAAKLGDGERVARQCSGGEVAFVKRLIDDSLALQTRVLFYTTMLGLKSSVKPLQRYLSLKGVTCHSVYELCQGCKMRFALGWTFAFRTTPATDCVQQVSETRHWPVMQGQFQWPVSEFRRHKMAVRSSKPIEWRLPAHRIANSDANDILQRVKQLLLDLNVDILSRKTDALHTEETATEGLKFQAFQPTWQHQRRKRRILLGKTKLDDASASNTDALGTEHEEMTPILKARIALTRVLPNSSTLATSETEGCEFLLSFFLLDATNKDYLSQLVQYFRNSF